MSLGTNIGNEVGTRMLRALYWQLSCLPFKGWDVELGTIGTYRMCLYGRKRTNKQRKEMSPEKEESKAAKAQTKYESDAAQKAHKE